MAFPVEPTLAPVVGAVLPVFGLVACGYLAGRFGLVTQASSHALNQFVYAFALPAMLFIAVYRGSQEVAAQDFLERAAIDGDEQHRRKRERVHELVQRFARGLRDEAETPGQQPAGDQTEDRQHRVENGR